MPPKKRTPAKKAAAKKATARQAQAPEPMDASVPETAEPVVATNHPRVAYAIKTLVSEFQALFPETPVEYSDYNGLNTAMSATFARRLATSGSCFRPRVPRP